MRLLRIHAWNIFSLGDVEYPLDRRGLVLITGYSNDEKRSNGSGKSSLTTKAITWGLYGVTPGGLRGDEVINRQSPKANAGVELDFEGVDGKSYRVVRKRRPGTLEFFQDTTNLTQRDPKGTQDLIDKALGRALGTFLQADFYGQGRRESYASLTPSEQKEILEEILSVQIDQWIEGARDNKTLVAQEISKHSHVLTGVTAKVEETKRHLEAMKVRRKEWEQRRVAELARVEREKRRIEEQLSVSQVNLQSLEKTLQEKLEQISQINVLRALQGPLVEEINGLTGALNEAEESLAAWDTQVKLLKSRVREIRENLCPTCGSRINEDLFQKLRDEQDSIRTELLEAEKIKEQARQARDGIQLPLPPKSRELEDLRMRLAKLEGVQQEVARLRETIAAFKNADLSVPLANLKARSEALANEVNPFSGTIKESEELLESYLSQKVVLDSTVGGLRDLQTAVEFWDGAFSKDIKNILFARACPFLTDRTNEHLRGLGNGHFTVTFSTLKTLKSGGLRDDFNVEVTSASGGGSFGALSGGEQKMVSFAIGLALSDLAALQAEGHSKILILDEPFTELDQENYEAIVTYLTSKISKEKETILLISNDEALKGLIPNRMEVIKDNGVTNLSL